MSYNLRSMKLEQMLAEPQGAAPPREVAKLQAALHNTAAQKRTYEKSIKQKQTLLQAQRPQLDQRTPQLLEWTLFLVLMWYVTVELELPPLSVVLACIISAVDLFPKPSRWSWICPIRTTSWTSAFKWAFVWMNAAVMTWFQFPFVLAMIVSRVFSHRDSLAPHKCLSTSGQFIFALASSRALTTFLWPSHALISGFVLASMSPQLLKAFAVTYPELKPKLIRLKSFFTDDCYDYDKDALAEAVADAWQSMWKSDVMLAVIKMASPMMQQVIPVLQNFDVFKSMCEVLLFLGTLGSKLGRRMLAVLTLTLLLSLITMETRGTERT